MTTFTCPVEECDNELSRLQVMHFRAQHGCDPVDWVTEYYGQQLREMYSTGVGSYSIADEYEWLSSDMVCEVVETRSHVQSLEGKNNPMRRKNVVKQFVGANNPSNRPDIREKIRVAVTGHTLSPEAKQKISEKNKGNVISKEHREAISKAASEMDRSYMQTSSYRNALSNALKGHAPTYPKPYEVEELGHSVRSSWEEAIGRLLVMGNFEYEYEHEFELSIGSYYPDFKVENIIIEVKGFATERSILKAEAFMKEFPRFYYVVIGDYIPCHHHLSWEERRRLPEVMSDVR